MVVRQLRGVIVWSDVAPGTRVEITVPLDAVSLRTGTERVAEAEWTTR